MRRRRDVEKHHLVRALVIVAQREFDGIAHIAKAALFGDAKLHAAGNLPVMHIEARYDTFRDHRRKLKRLEARINLRLRSASILERILTYETQKGSVTDPFFSFDRMGKGQAFLR